MSNSYIQWGFLFDFSISLNMQIQQICDLCILTEREPSLVDLGAPTLNLLSN